MDSVLPSTGSTVVVTPAVTWTGAPLVQNQIWMVMHLLPCYWFQSLKTQRMVVHEIDLVGKTISSFNKAQQNMRNVAACSPIPCMCCKNTRIFKITLEHKTNEMTETSTLLKLQSFLTSISGLFEYIATKWRAYRRQINCGSALPAVRICTESCS